MKTIDMATWKRRSRFEWFAAYDDPTLTVQIDVDVTRLRAACRLRKRSFYYATLFSVLQATNSTPAMRQRIRGSRVIEHEKVGISFTILDDNDEFNFCRMPYEANLGVFEAACRQQADRLRQGGDLVPDPPGGDDRVFTSCFPWNSFTATKPPRMSKEASSIPLVMWGRDFDDNGRRRMPVALTGHHGFLDGKHMARFFETLQRWMDHLAEDEGNVLPEMAPR